MMAMTTSESPRATITSSRSRSCSRSSMTLPLLLSLLLLVAATAAAAAPAAAVAQAAALTPFSFLTIGDWVRACIWIERSGVDLRLIDWADGLMDGGI